MSGRLLLALLMGLASGGSPPAAAAGIIATSSATLATRGAGTSDVLAVYPDRIVVINPVSPDDWGAIPLQGTVHSALWLMERHLLLVHLPEQKTMAVIDTRPDSIKRYRAIASYQSPEFADAGLRFALSGGRVYLVRDRQAVVIFDPQSLLAKIGLYAVDFLPVVYSTATRVILSDRIVALEHGQLTVESTRPRPGEVAAPRYVRLPYRPTAMLPQREGGLLFLSGRADDGSGRIVALDARTMEPAQEIAFPHAITSMAWLDDGRLCVLSADEGRFAILDLQTWRWSRVWAPKIPGRPLRLLSAAPPPALGGSPEGIGFGEVYEP